MPANTDDQIISNNETATGNIYPNILNQFSSFTYNLKLQVTTPSNYNEMIAAQKYDASQWTTIMQSGGVGLPRAHNPNNLNGKEYFQRDLYFDDLEFKTLVGMNQENRGSNAMDINFTIIEPNGMDLIEELYDFCHDSAGLNEKNYCQLPYMLVINFSGFHDDGSYELAENAAKYIPIQILNITAKVNDQGAIYSVQAIPFNEIPNTEMYGRVDGQIECQGKILADYCNSFANILNSHQQANQKKNLISQPDTYAIIFANQTSTEAGGSDIQIGTYNLAPSNQIALKDKNMGPPVSQENKINLEVLAGNFSSYQTLNNANPDQTIINLSNSSVKFNSGSSIIDCLNNLIISSEYITQQVVKYRKQVDDINTQAQGLGPNAQNNQGIKDSIAKLNYPVQWFVIVPSIKLGQFDPLRNVYSRTITYTIKPYIVDNSSSLNAPNQTPQLRVVKEYNYILTGKNIDILNFELNFNTGYLTYSQNNITTKGQGSGAQIPDKPQSPLATTSQATGSNKLQSPPGPFNDSKINQPAPNSPKSTTGTGEQTLQKNIASDIAASIYAPAEMLQIDFTILGDPDYIKQDGIFLNPGQTLTPYQVGQGSQPGGILFNSGEIYLRMNFLIPQDINLNTGIVNLNFAENSTQYRRNIFSGLYRVLQVTNKLTHGKFTQDIEAIRYDDSHAFVIGSSSGSTTTVTS